VNKLRPYQHTMVNHIIDNPRCALFVSMGMGKSLATLSALVDLALVEDVFPALIVAPLRVAKSTWPDEIVKWDHTRHLKVSSVIGTPKERIAALNAPADIYTINYDNLDWLTTHLDGAWPFKTIVADELTRLKSFRTRQGSKRAAALAKHAHKSKRFIGLTGTPAANGLVDLWGSMWFIDGGNRLLKSYSAFDSRWFRVGYDGFSRQPMPHSQGEIQSRIADVCLSLDPKEHFDLRDPIVNTIEVDLPKDARKLYDSMEKQMYMELDGDGIEAFGAAARTIKCLQIAGGAVITDDQGNWSELHAAKLDALESIVEEAAGAPVLVAYHFRSDLVRLLKRFPQGRHLDKDPKTLKAWNAGKVPLLFAHPASAGHGLSMQDGGNIIAFFGIWWNLEEHAQIIERIGPTRQAQSGYNRPVFVHYITAKNTVDQLVLERIRTKREVQDILLTAMQSRKATP
jgi:SNF2 family DNA or RNA helicase